MDFINYHEDELFIEGCSTIELAKQFGTPLYLYSKALLQQNWNAFISPLTSHRHLVCYAVKANSNLAILNLLAGLGAGFDIVSLGELERVLKAGGDPKKIVFSGVAKSREEITRALEVGIHCFNVESLPELLHINQIAGELGCKAPISLRINPDVDAKTHPYISTGLKENKFGISYPQALESYRQAAQLPHITILGMDCHIGSQLTELSPFLDATDRLLQLIDKLAEEGITISHLDLGGGLGVRYHDETPPSPACYIQALLAKIKPYPHLTLCLEPGRSIVANIGILVTQITYLKTQDALNFAIVDAGMNDLLRPALYQSWMNIIPLKRHLMAELKPYHVVGPVCETSDFLGKDRVLALQEGEYLAVCGAGAYGFSMSSNYNSRCRPAEIMVDGQRSFMIRKRETLEDLWQGEQLIAP